MKSSAQLPCIFIRTLLVARTVPPKHFAVKLVHSFMRILTPRAAMGSVVTADVVIESIVAPHRDGAETHHSIAKMRRGMSSVI